MTDADRREITLALQTALDKEGAERKKLWAQGQAQQHVLGMLVHDLATLLPELAELRLREARLELQRRRQLNEESQETEVQWHVVRSLEGALRSE